MTSSMLNVRTCRKIWIGAMCNMCKAACKLQYKNYSKQSVLADSVRTWSPSLKLDYLSMCTDTTSDQQPYQLHIQSSNWWLQDPITSKKSVRQSLFNRFVDVCTNAHTFMTKNMLVACACKRYRDVRLRTIALSEELTHLVAHTHYFRQSILNEDHHLQQFTAYTHVNVVARANHINLQRYEQISGRVLLEHGSVHLRFPV